MSLSACSSTFNLFGVLTYSFLISWIFIYLLFFGKGCGFSSFEIVKFFNYMKFCSLNLCNYLVWIYYPNVHFQHVQTFHRISNLMVGILSVRVFLICFGGCMVMMVSLILWIYLVLQDLRTCLYFFLFLSYSSSKGYFFSSLEPVCFKD